MPFCFSGNGCGILPRAGPSAADMTYTHEPKGWPFVPV